MTDCKNLELAREWAEWMHDNPDVYGGTSDRARAAADLIPSLPDQWVDAEKLREVIKRLRHKGESPVTPTELGRVYLRCAEAMESLLPAPPAPEHASPHPEDVPMGEPWQVEVDGQEFIGYRNGPGSSFPWAIIRGDEPVSDYCTDTEVTLIARLVPETTKQDTKTVFDPAYTYRDRDGDEWQHILGAWRWLDTAGDINGNYDTPPAEYGPYTRIEA